MKKDQFWISSHGFYPDSADTFAKALDFPR